MKTVGSPDQEASMHNLFENLDDEWQRLVRSRQARHATQHWGELGGVDLDALVTTVQRRGNPARSDRILAALVGHAATDDFAARTVLQCLLPGLKVLAVDNRNLEEPDELDAIVVAAAWERIRTYPQSRRPHHIASNILLDSRQAVARSRRLRRPLASPGDAANVASSCSTDAREQITALVAHTHRAGVLSTGDARLIVETRVLGFNIADIARHTGMTPASVRQRRARAEARLVASVA
jgi:hypothetical protein